MQSTHSHNQTHLHKNRLSNTQRQTMSHSDTAKSQWTSHLCIINYHLVSPKSNPTRLDRTWYEIYWNKGHKLHWPAELLINYLNPVLLEQTRPGDAKHKINLPPPYTFILFHMSGSKMGKTRKPAFVILQCTSTWSFSIINSSKSSVSASSRRDADTHTLVPCSMNYHKFPKDLQV